MLKSPLSPVFLLLLLAWTLPDTARAQSRQLKGQVIHAENAEPIPFANVRIVGTALGVAADARGRFTLGLPQDTSRLEVSALGFRTKTLVPPVNARKFTVALQPDNELPTVTVTAGNQEKSQRLLVQKHLPEFITRWGELLVIAYRRAGKKQYQLHILDRHGITLSEHQLEVGQLTNMTTRCSDLLYLVNHEVAISFLYENGRLLTQECVPKRYYNHLFAGCHTKVTDDSYLIEQKWANGLLKKYLLIDGGGSQRLITSYADTASLDNFAEDRRHMVAGWLKSNMGDIGWRENEVIRNMQERGDFYMTTVYYNHENNHFLKDRERLVFFNFDDEVISFFDEEGERIEDASLPLKVAAGDGFESNGEVLLDPVSRRYYTLAADRRGHRLYEFHPKTGQLIFVDAVETEIIKNTVIINGRWYVLGRKDINGMDSQRHIFVRELDQYAHQEKKQ